MGIELMVGPFIGSYVTLDKPKLVKGSTKELYSVMALLPAGFDLGPMKKAALAAIEEKPWGKGKSAAVAGHPKFKKPWKDQAEMVDNDGELRAGMTAGQHFVNFSNVLRPMLLDESATELLSAEKLYSGAQYRAKVECYAWEHETGGRGVTFSLLGIQKIGDGPRLGGTGARASTSDFEPVAGSGKTASDVFGDADDPFADAPKTKRATDLDDEIPF